MLRMFIDRFYLEININADYKVSRVSQWSMGRGWTFLRIGTREIDQEDKVDDLPCQEFELEIPQSESGTGTLQSHEKKAHQHQCYGKDKPIRIVCIKITTHNDVCRRLDTRRICMWWNADKCYYSRTSLRRTSHKTDTSIKRTLTPVPDTYDLLRIDLYKTDTSVRRTLSVVSDGVRLMEVRLYLQVSSHEQFAGYIEHKYQDRACDQNPYDGLASILALGNQIQVCPHPGLIQTEQRCLGLFLSKSVSRS